jgi:hypothetical protein
MNLREMKCLTPELFNGQAPRPAWMKSLQEHELARIDMMANEATKNDHAYEEYVAYTDALRRRP